MIKQIIILSIFVTLAFSACNADSVDADATGVVATAAKFNLGKCCKKAADAATYVKDATSVATCPTASAGAIGEVAPATCVANYAIVSDTCTACAQGSASTGAAGAACAVCAANQYVQSDGTCADRAAGATAIANCQVYSADTGGKCLVSVDGYKTITTVGGVDTVPDADYKCFANCKSCTGTTETTCTMAMAGYYINDFAADAKKVVACSSDSLCAECTFVKGDSATNGQVSCTKTQSGAYLDKTVAAAVVAKACVAGKGSPADNTGEVASCVDCDKTVFCVNCKATNFCSSCLPGYVLNATTGACTAYAGTTHGTCLKANADGDSACQSCDAAKNRELEDDSTSTTTPKAKVATGKCVCKAGFGDQSTLSTPNFTCVECGTNVSTCSFSATGKTVLTCAANTFKTGADCKAQDATDVVGFFYNTATSAFANCHASCSKCTGTLVNNCSACPDAPTGWTEPTSAATNFATYIKGPRALINNTCYSDCPSGFVANTAQSNCVAGAATASSKSVGVFAIITLVFSIFLIF